MPEFRFALRSTIPVLVGYLVIGVGFGLLIQQAGYSWWFALLMSLLVFAGAAQYLSVGFLTQGAGLAEVAGLTFLLNARHMVYGLSLLEKYKSAGVFKPYLVFALTDETYALNAGLVIPKNLEPRKVYFLISLLDQSYWCLGTVIGALAGSMIPFPLEGIDFALTALFTVLVAEQWQQHKKKMPFFIGLAVSVLSLVFLGPSGMLLPSIASGFLALLLVKGRLPVEE